MKITAIKVQNFVGARDVDVKLTKPICLFAGKNFSGKSSLQEAVRMALTGESVRVSLKKDYRKLVTERAEVGFCVVEHDGQQSAITLPNGAHEHTGQGRPSPLLNFCLDAQRFARLPEDERRTFLFGLMKLRTDGPAVTDRLIAKGCHAAKVEAIAPFLRAGFDAAHKEAQVGAREAKASWRTITGETYGNVKAARWAAQKPVVDERKILVLRHDVANLDARIETAQAQYSELQGRAKAAAEQSAKLAGLRQRAGTYARIAGKLKADEADLQKLREALDQLKKTCGPRLPNEPTYTCPSCSATLRHDHAHANGALVAFTPAPPVDVESADKLVEYEKAVALMERSVANDKRDLEDADAAARLLSEIDEADVEAPDAGELDAIKARVDDAKKSRSILLGEIATLENEQRAAAVADKRTADAAALHTDVAQWEAIADTMAPNGIPGEMLAEALGPINERLAKSSNESQWLRVGIDADMSIVADGGRPYALLSESERWRADAMIAEAVSFLSGVRILVLDRIDVLDLPGREDLLYWLDGLAADGEIETALLFGTLKALPTVSGNIEAVWIENGTAGLVREAA